MKADATTAAVAVAGGEVPATAAAPRADRAFVFAREHGTRASEVNQFYNGFTGKDRSLAAHRWEFFAGPGGPALVWTITEAVSRRIVGHHAIVPTPMVCRGVTVPGGRTENTIIDPAFRTKVFYPGMEKRALAETLESLRVVYTIHSTGPGRLRERLGYSTAGRWVVYVPRSGPLYLRALLRRGSGALGLRVPEVALGAAARTVGVAQRLRRGLRGRSGVIVQEVENVDALGGEYEAFWARARDGYPMTIDRSPAFLRWRFADNPHLRCRTWTVRRGGRLAAVIIGHRHVLEGASALYVDDIVVGAYGEADFTAAVSCLDTLDPGADSVVLTTLAVDTPLHRVLRRRFPVQARLLDRYGSRLFDEMLVLDKSDADNPEPWYVTAIFTEGMDTSR
ncbi:hypothetical protein L6Q96_12730 [Candidatus Binatia bacterium]|nr:hypothetical protein [Candidatus Binatia bacterium]